MIKFLGGGGILKNLLLVYLCKFFMILMVSDKIIHQAKLYNQNPLEKFYIYTIYPNYTFTLTIFQGERERQIALVKERVQRVRYERTQTTIKPKLGEKRQFEEFLSQDESGLSEDERMMKIADRINSQFKKDESNYKTGTKSVSLLFSILFLFNTINISCKFHCPS